MNFMPSWKIFFTLSCEDNIDEENFTSVLGEEYTVVYKVIKGRKRAFIVTNGKEQSMDEFLSQNLTKHEFIRQNVLTATRNFNY